MANDMIITGSTELSTEAPQDFFGDKNGFEGVDRDCVQTPFLKIAQASTDETKEQNALYMEGLKPGMFFCPSLRKIYGKSINIAIVHFDRTFTIYEGTGKDSKFKGSMSPAKFKRDIEPFGEREKSYVLYQGLRYVDSRNFLVVPYDSPYDGVMMFSMSSTGIKPSTSLLTQATHVITVKDGEPVTAPMWASVWGLTTDYFTDPKGDYFQVASIARKGWVNKKMASKLKPLFDEMDGVEVSPASEAEVHITIKDAVPTGNPTSMAKQAAGGENEEIF